MGVYLLNSPDFFGHRFGLDTTIGVNSCSESITN